MICHFKTIFMSDNKNDLFSFFTDEHNLILTETQLNDIVHAVKETLIPDKICLSFNDVKSCCHDDSAGGGCLYLDEEKLKQIVRERVTLTHSLDESAKEC